MKKNQKKKEIYTVIADKIGSEEYTEKVKELPIDKFIQWLCR
jgi:hypothetical protein